MKGFTLIETLVAIAIMMLAIAGPLTIAHKAVQSALYAKNQITAYYLAQDTIEFIRSMRDNNLLATNAGTVTDWLDNLDLCKDKDCMIDTINGTTNNSGPLYYKNGQYGYNNTWTTSSGFTRTVNINISKTNNAMVKVTVSWNTGLFTQTFTVQENMMNIFATTP